MYTREALLRDATQIHDLIASYSGDGTLLPRTLPEICENIRDFVVGRRKPHYRLRSVASPRSASG